MRRALPLILFALGLVALGVAATVMLVPKAGQVATSSVGGPFTLTDQDGRRVTERDFAGATHLVFFGFTHCPDVCPTTLQQIGDVLQALGPKGKDTKALFIAVDPERDTPEALKTYLASFDPRIVGLTGSQEEVNAAVKAYRAYVPQGADQGGRLHDGAHGFGLHHGRPEPLRERPQPDETRRPDGGGTRQGAVTRHGAVPGHRGGCGVSAPLREVRDRPCSVLFQRSGARISSITPRQAARLTSRK